MLVLQRWNDELETKAQSWADNCFYAHDNTGSNRSSQYDQLGENLYYTTGNLVNMTRIVQRWYDEKKDYNHATMSCKQGRRCGHYTQVRTYNLNHYA